MGKTQNLLHDFFGLTVSRAGLLGQLHWGGQLFAPVVEELLELLRQSPVVQGDETGWRINGKTAWAWCFRDPRLALFLIDRHRSRDVIVRVLGESFAGTLVSDFSSQSVVRRMPIAVRSYVARRYRKNIRRYRQ